MAATLATDVKVSIAWVLSDALDLATPTDSGRLEYYKSLATGTGSNLADRIWTDSRTLASAATETLDLTALAYAVFGISGTLTINFVKVKQLFIVNVATTAGEDLTIGNAASTPLLGPLGGTTPTQKCYADSPLIWSNKVSGWSTSGANNLKIVNSGAASNTFKILVVGTSA